MESGYLIIASISPRDTHTYTFVNCLFPFSCLFPSYIAVRWLAKILFLFSVSQQLLCPCVSFVLSCAFALSFVLCTSVMSCHPASQSLTALFPSLLSQFFSIGSPIPPYLTTPTHHHTPYLTNKYNKMQHRERYSHTGTSQTSS